VIHNEAKPAIERNSRRGRVATIQSAIGSPRRRSWAAYIAEAGWFIDWQTAKSAKKPQLPRGAIIRTILKDVSPDAITGATLFHEHSGAH
jgi:hypothetical protein